REARAQAQARLGVRPGPVRGDARLGRGSDRERRVLGRSAPRAPLSGVTSGVVMASLLIATALLAAPSAYTLAVGPRALREVESLAGDIRIEAGAPGEVAVEAMVEGGGFQAAATPTSRGVRVQAVCGVRLQRDYTRCGRGQVRLLLRVPADAEVRVQAVRGD